jgi:hypothetical protein
MKRSTHKSAQQKAFEGMLRSVLQTSHSELQKRIEAEKAAKKAASDRASGEKD